VILDWLPSNSPRATNQITWKGLKRSTASIFATLTPYPDPTAMLFLATKRRYVHTVVSSCERSPRHLNFVSYMTTEWCRSGRRSETNASCSPACWLVGCPQTTTTAADCHDERRKKQDSLRACPSSSRRTRWTCHDLRRCRSNGNLSCDVSWLCFSSIKLHIYQLQRC